jgi:hypothetical protein
VGEAGSTYRIESLRGRDHLEDPDADGKIMLE